MPDFTLIEGKAWHCGAIARRLRMEHYRNLVMAGMDIHRELRSTFDASSYSRTWLIDGRISGMGGIVGADIAATGYVWIAVTEAARKYPFEIIRTVRRELDAVMKIKRELACIVLPGDEAACRFAAFMGFHVAHQGPGSPAYSRFGRRNLVRHVRTSPDLHMPFGKASCVPMGYHRASETA